MNYTDNKSLVDTINSTKMLTENRLKVDICMVREIVQNVKSRKWHGVILIPSWQII